MSVASRATARRWAAALAGLVAVALAPYVVDRLPGHETGASPRQLLSSALHSSGVAHQGLVESTGTLGLPDLPRLGDVAALLGATTRARVWWRSPTAWRVDRISTTGESGLYAVPGGVQTWDFETGTVERAVGASPVRLPRTDDLLPPQATRRVLAGVAADDRVTALPARRVAGRDAAGVRVVPADGASTIGHLDVYVDEANGLPLSLVVVPRGSDVPALRTAFVDISYGRPSDGVLTPHSPPFTPLRTTDTPDLATAVDRFAPFALPGTLGGSPRTPDLVGSTGGTATYGRGLARFIVLPLGSRLGRPAMGAATAGGGTAMDVGARGEAVLVSTPLLNAVVAHSDTSTDDRGDLRDRYYLLTGTVDATALQSAARELVDDPPPVR